MTRVGYLINSWYGIASAPINAMALSRNRYGFSRLLYRKAISSRWSEVLRQAQHDVPGRLSMTCAGGRGQS